MIESETLRGIFDRLTPDDITYLQDLAKYIEEGKIRLTFEKGEFIIRNIENA